MKGSERVGDIVGISRQQRLGEDHGNVPGKGKSTSRTNIVLNIQYSPTCLLLVFGGFLMVTIQVHCALGYMTELYLSEDDRLSLTAPVESSIPLPQLEDIIHTKDQF